MQIDTSGPIRKQPGSRHTWRARNDGPVYFRPVRSNPVLNRCGVRRCNMTQQAVTTNKNSRRVQGHTMDYLLFAAGMRLIGSRWDLVYRCCPCWISLHSKGNFSKPQMTHRHISYFWLPLKVAQYVRANRGRGTANQISRVLDQYVNLSGHYEC